MTILLFIYSETFFSCVKFTRIRYLYRLFFYTYLKPWVLQNFIAVLCHKWWRESFRVQKTSRVLSPHIYIYAHIYIYIYICLYICAYIHRDFQTMGSWPEGTWASCPWMESSDNLYTQKNFAHLRMRPAVFFCLSRSSVSVHPPSSNTRRFKQWALLWYLHMAGMRQT